MHSRNRDVSTLTLLCKYATVVVLQQLLPHERHEWWLPTAEDAIFANQRDAYGQADNSLLGLLQDLFWFTTSLKYMHGSREMYSSSVPTTSVCCGCYQCGQLARTLPARRSYRFGSIRTL